MSFFKPIFLLLLESNSYSWFPIQGSNLCPCIGGWILNHWTTRKAPRMALWGFTCSTSASASTVYKAFWVARPEKDQCGGYQLCSDSPWPCLILGPRSEDGAPLSVNWWPGSPKVLYADAALQAALSVSSICNTHQVQALVDADIQGRDGLSQELGSPSVCCSAMKCPSQAVLSAFLICA